MKMICEVPDEVIKCIKDGMWCGSHVAEEMIENGIPLSISEDGTLTVNVEDGSKVSRVLVCGDNHIGGMYYPDQEPCEEREKGECPYYAG